MTTPPADQGDQQEAPWSQPQPQNPPPHGQAGPARHPGQEPASYPPPGPPGSSPPGSSPPGAAPGSSPPRSSPPGYPPPGYPPPGYPPTDYPPPGYPQPGYPPAGYPPPGYSPPGLPGYPSAPGAVQNPPYYSPGQAGPAGPEGPAAPDGPRTGSALTALVLGVLGLLSSFFASILAIIFGIVALVRIRKTGSRGRAMAITGIVFGVTWTGLAVLFIVLAIHATDYGSIGRLQAGACFDDTQPHQVSTQVQFLSSCTQPHNGEIVGTFALSGSGWPGTSAVQRQASAGCAAMLGTVLPQYALGSGVSLLNYTPDQRAWSAGDRSASCVLIDPNARRTGSMFAASAP